MQIGDSILDNIVDQVKEFLQFHSEKEVRWRIFDEKDVDVSHFESILTLTQVHSISQTFVLAYQ